MSQAVYVRAPCRLHFGMFSFGHADRPQFGGVGVMIEPPAVEVEIRPAARFDVSGLLGKRAHQFAESAAAAWHLPQLPPCQITVRAPSDHVGLGVGTQLGLSVAAGLRRWLRLPDMRIESLAAAVGRARRSAVGTYGFEQGGLIVDSGSVRSASPTKAPDEVTVGNAHATRLKRRLAIPGEWRFVLVRPERQRGLAGANESDAFARLSPVPETVTRELWRITDDEMLPAVESSQCHEFGEALYRFGRLAGECFARVQGGPFANAETAHLVDAIRRQGVSGVGQSSWGPTLFAVCPSQLEAQALVDALRHTLEAGNHEMIVASPNNTGALIR